MIYVLLLFNRVTISKESCCGILLEHKARCRLTAVMQPCSRHCSFITTLDCSYRQSILVLLATHYQCLCSSATPHTGFQQTGNFGPGIQSIVNHLLDTPDISCDILPDTQTQSRSSTHSTAQKTDNQLNDTFEGIMPFDFDELIFREEQLVDLDSKSLISLY